MCHASIITCSFRFFPIQKKAKISFVMKIEFNRDVFNGKEFYDKKAKV